MIEIRIKKKMGNFTLDVNFHGENRDHIGILGASGCGKSITLKCIAGIIKPDEGRIVLNGKVLYDSQLKINLPPQKRKVGYLFQNYALFPNMTVEENIQIGIHNTSDRKVKQQMVHNFLSKFQLEDLGNRYPSELSGGQQQRVALARILANEPDIILLDEPFSALDSYLKEELQTEMFQHMREYQGEVILVSHSRDEIYKLTEKLAIMDAGKIITFNGTKKIFQEPIYIEAARLTGCKNISLAKKIGDYHIKAIDWNVNLRTVLPVPDDISYVGIRAHHIIFTNEIRDIIKNKFSIKLIQTQELPFDSNYIVENSIGSKNILIKVTNENCMDKSINQIIMPADKLILLR